jgi:uncharacterized transporter YbjL
VPVASKIVLRDLGRSIFLGQVAIASGRPIVDILASQDPAVKLAAFLVLVTLVATVLVVRQRVRIRFGDLLGVCAGATQTQPFWPARAVCSGASARMSASSSRP